MSDVNEMSDRKLMRYKSSAPNLQRIYWIIGSIVGAFAVYNIVLPFIHLLSIADIQLLIVSLCVAMIILLIGFRPANSESEWNKLLNAMVDVESRLHRASIELEDTFDYSSEILNLVKRISNVPDELSGIIAEVESDSRKALDLGIDAYTEQLAVLKLLIRKAMIENVPNLVSDFQMEYSEVKKKLDSIREKRHGLKQAKIKKLMETIKKIEAKEK